MSELGQLDAYYRIVYDYLQPDRLLSCAEGVFLSVVGVRSGFREDDDDDDIVDNSLDSTQRTSFSSSHHLWCVVSTVQSRVLLALLLYFCLCLIFIRLAWLLYGQHINDLFIRSGIEQAQQQAQQAQQQANYGGNPVKSSTKHQAKTD